MFRGSQVPITRGGAGLTWAGLTVCSPFPTFWAILGAQERCRFGSFAEETESLSYVSLSE